MDDEWLFEEWIHYNELKRLMEKFEDEIGKIWKRMQELGAEIRAYQEGNYVYIMMKPFLDQTRLWYNAMLKEGYGILNGPDGSQHNSGMELFVPAGFRHAMMTSKASFYFNCWTKFLDIYKWYMNVKATHLSKKITAIENDHTKDGLYQMRKPFLQAYNLALEGLRAMNRIMTFDMDNPEEVPSYECIRYIVTQTFRFLHKMLLVNSRTSRRGETPDRDRAQVVARQQALEEKADDVSKKIFNIETMSTMRLIHPGDAEDYISYPKIRARPIRKKDTGSDLEFLKMHTPMSPFSASSSASFHSPTAHRMSSPAKRKSPIRTDASATRPASPVQSGRSSPPSGSRSSPPSQRRIPPPSGNRIPSPSGNQIPLPSGNRIPPPSGSRIPPPSGSRIPPPSGSRIPPPSGSRIPPPSAIRIPPNRSSSIPLPNIYGLSPESNGKKTKKQVRSPYVLHIDPLGAVAGHITRGRSQTFQDSKRRIPIFATRRMNPLIRSTKLKNKKGSKRLPSNRLIKKSILRPKTTLKNRVSLLSKNLAKPRVSNLVWQGHVPTAATAKTPKRGESPKRVSFRDPPITNTRLFGTTTNALEKASSSGRPAPGNTPFRKRIPPPAVGIPPPRSRIPQPESGIPSSSLTSAPSTSGVKPPSGASRRSAIRPPEFVTVRRSRSPSRPQGPGPVEDPENLERLRAKFRSKKH